MDKPAKVEVGQRWRVNDCGCELVASDQKRQSNPNAPVLHVAVGEPSCAAVPYWGHWGINPHAATFLGYAEGYGPQAPTVEAPAPSPEVKREAPAATPAHHWPSLICYAQGCERCKIPTPTAAAQWAAGATEMQENGRPLSARAIRAMRERLPKPEPWRPSVTEWDLLPDAGR